jgi:hypothetical protein
MHKRYPLHRYPLIESSSDLVHTGDDLSHPFQCALQLGAFVFPASEQFVPVPFSANGSRFVLVPALKPLAASIGSRGDKLLGSSPVGEVAVAAEGESDSLRAGQRRVSWMVLLV